MDTFLKSHINSKRKDERQVDTGERIKENNNMYVQIVYSSQYTVFTKSLTSLSI